MHEIARSNDFSLWICVHDTRIRKQTNLSSRFFPSRHSTVLVIVDWIKNTQFTILNSMDILAHVENTLRELRMTSICCSKQIERFCANRSLDLVVFGCIFIFKYKMNGIPNETELKSNWNALALNYSKRIGKLLSLKTWQTLISIWFWPNGVRRSQWTTIQDAKDDFIKTISNGKMQHTHTGFNAGNFHRWSRFSMEIADSTQQCIHERVFTSMQNINL